ncbi:MAG: hypothetical protein DMF88_02085 [Acidobacteria bacterium]|nr:MAG: hypothetical protein DMF88_02085 [Acidobacteriota bacterium]
MMRLAVSVVRRFYLTMALATTLVVIAGFAPSYYLRPFVRVTHYPTGIPVSPTLPLLIHIHAVVLSLWLVLLLVQTTLVAAGRTEVHKRLGIAGAALVPVILVLGVLTAIRGARDGWNPGGPFADSLEFLIVGLGDITLFTGFVAAALYYRRQPEIHKRLMILGALGGLMWPAITRIPYIAPHSGPMFGLLLALVAAAPIRDYTTRRRIHPVTLWGSLIILASFPLREVVAKTSAWHVFAAWMIR